MPPAATEGRRTTRRVFVIAGVLLLVLLGGCAALVAVVGPRVLASVTAPVEVANDYLDAARTGAELDPFVCRSGAAVHGDVARCQGQCLHQVEIDGS